MAAATATANAKADANAKAVADKAFADAVAHKTGGALVALADIGPIDTPAAKWKLNAEQFFKVWSDLEFRVLKTVKSSSNRVAVVICDVHGNVGMQCPLESENSEKYWELVSDRNKAADLDDSDDSSDSDAVSVAFDDVSVASDVVPADAPAVDVPADAPVAAAVVAAAPVAAATPTPADSDDSDAPAASSICQTLKKASGVTIGLIGFMGLVASVMSFDAVAAKLPEQLSDNIEWYKELISCRLPEAVSPTVAQTGVAAAGALGMVGGFQTFLAGKQSA